VELRRIVDENSPRHILVVTGGKSYQSSGSEQMVTAAVRNRPHTVLTQTSANPTIEDLRRAVARFRAVSPDLVIGIGGGSVIDLAKAVSLMGPADTDPLDFLQGDGESSGSKVTTIILPTTAGSGSESTHFAVIYVNGAKHSLACVTMLPEYVILDSALTDSLPPEVTAHTGLDALCQAIESYWSVLATEASRATSLDALSLILKNIVGAAKNPTDSLRDAMLQGANLAGQAINVAHTTAAHALSYRLTIRHGLPHGYAVALILPHLIQFNATAPADKIVHPEGPHFIARLMDRLSAVLGVAGPHLIPARLNGLISEIGLIPGLAAHGISHADLPDIAAAATRSGRAENNPVELNDNDLRSILEAAL
jgi:alcohol dehydrogenase class IV